MQFFSYFGHFGEPCESTLLFITERGLKAKKCREGNISTRRGCRGCCPPMTTQIIVSFYSWHHFSGISTYYISKLFDMSYRRKIDKFCLQKLQIEKSTRGIKQGYALKQWVEGLSDEAYYP